MRIYLFLFVLIFSFIITSCATIVSGSRQIVKISSEPASAEVFINEVQVGITPLEQNLKRNMEYNVVIKLSGYKPYETAITQAFNGWYLGNIVFGGIIGLIVDAGTGAMYRLTPEELSAKLQADGSVFSSKGDNLYISVTLEVDPNWEKVGQLTPTR